MNPMGFVVVAAALSVAYMAARSWSVRQIALRRLSDEAGVHRLAVAVDASSNSALARWLSAAGYRRPNAQTVFVATTAAFAGAGLAVSQIYRTVLLPSLTEMVSNAPGSTADVLVAILQGGPSILFVLTGLVPMLVVRTARRLRVRAIEQDLPLALELLATMAEAGLGFDAALSKIVRARGSDRALMSEFVNFQRDMLAGIPRVQALRQLARRVDVASLTRLTSALVQAEQAGASMTDTLQHQAEDLRQRRREDALLQAQALPVKLVFPLVICFLPSIFVSTLAPVIYQMVVMADNVLGSAGR